MVNHTWPIRNYYVGEPERIIGSTQENGLDMAMTTLFSWLELTSRKKDT